MFLTVMDVVIQSCGEFVVVERRGLGKRISSFSAEERRVMYTITSHTPPYPQPAQLKPIVLIHPSYH